MSVVTYNGVTLPYASATDFRQEAVYEDSGTDRIYTKFDIRVRCLINADVLTMLAPDLIVGGNPQTDNAATIMKAVRARLMRPRKRLQFNFNGFNLIPYTQDDQAGTVDAKNGPQPMSCEIVSLQDVSFLLSYHVVAHYWENNRINPLDNDPARVVENRVGNNVLSNRWSETVEIDDCQYTKRIRDGKFIIRSDNDAGRIADTFRSQFAVLSVPVGFLRTAAKYTQSPDGLAIQYHIEDTEVFLTPPPPAFAAEGEYILNTAKKSAHLWHEVRVKLKGSKNTIKSRLISAAIGVAVNKLGTVGANLATGTALLDASNITVGLYNNDVEVRLRTMAVPAPEDLGLSRFLGIWGLPLKKIAVTPNSDPVEPATPGYADRGTAGLLLRAASYFDPSLTNIVLGESSSTGDNLGTEVGDTKLQNLPGPEVGTLGQRTEARDS